MLLMAILGLGAFEGWQLSASTPAETTPPEIRGMAVPLYEPQKVVYHVTEGGGLMARGRHKNLLQMARNHLDAVGKDWLELHLVLQGDGLDLLRRAKTDPDLSRRIDALKKDGVRLVVCLNTITGKNIDPFKSLYGVTRDDIIGAGNAEVTALVQRGFVYLKPQD